MSPEGRYTMKITNQRRSDMLKRSVIFTLIMAMLITLVPTTNVSAASVAYMTECRSLSISVRYEIFIKLSVRQ